MSASYLINFEVVAFCFGRVSSSCYKHSITNVLFPTIKRKESYKCIIHYIWGC